MIPDRTNQIGKLHAEHVARAWKFIFDAHRKKAGEQGNSKTKAKSLNTEEGGPHDLEGDFL